MTQLLRDRLALAGVSWLEVRSWAVGTGRWTDAELPKRAPDEDAVDAYLAERSQGRHTPGADIPASRFDDLFADPEFWSDLSVQATRYVAAAPVEWRAPLRSVAEGAHGIHRLATGSPS